MSQKYQSNKEIKIDLFKKFLNELKEDYISTYPEIRKLDYQLTITLLCEKMIIYPKDAVKFLEMAFQKGELKESREISLGEKITKIIEEQIEKNKPEVEKEIKEVGL